MRPRTSTRSARNTPSPRRSSPSGRSAATPGCSSWCARSLRRPTRPRTRGDASPWPCAPRRAPSRLRCRRVRCGRCACSRPPPHRGGRGGHDDGRHRARAIGVRLRRARASPTRCANRSGVRSCETCSRSERASAPSRSHARRAVPGYVVEAFRAHLRCGALEAPSVAAISARARPSSRSVTGRRCERPARAQGPAKESVKPLAAARKVPSA